MSKLSKSLRCQILVPTATRRQIKHTHCGVVRKITRIATKQKHDFCPLGGGGIKFSGFSEGLTPDLYPMVYIIGSKK